jgi:hypothetical protein
MLPLTRRTRTKKRRKENAVMARTPKDALMERTRDVLKYIPSLLKDIQSLLKEPYDDELKDPLRNPDTAFGKLDEDKYRAERDLVDRYQAFVAELLRLSLLGIALFGFLYKITFEAGAPIGVAHVLAALGILAFGISALTALLFRFFATTSLGLYIQALRFKECTPPKMEDAKKSLDRRHLRNRICTRSKLIAALTLAVGGALVAFAVILFIFDLGRQTGA